MNVPKLLDDEREIECISNAEWFAFSGQNGVTKIVVYSEPGQGAYVPWFAVYHDDFLAERVSASEVVVTYKEG